MARIWSKLDGFSETVMGNLNPNYHKILCEQSVKDFGVSTLKSLRVPGILEFLETPEFFKNSWSKQRESLNKLLKTINCDVIVTTVGNYCENIVKNMNNRFYEIPLIVIASEDSKYLEKDAILPEFHYYEEFVREILHNNAKKVDIVLDPENSSVDIQCREFDTDKFNECVKLIKFWKGFSE